VKRAGMRANTLKRTSRFALCRSDREDSGSISTWTPIFGPQWRCTFRRPYERRRPDHRRLQLAGSYRRRSARLIAELGHKVRPGRGAESRACSASAATPSLLNAPNHAPE
jgi:hypothetical protein